MASLKQLATEIIDIIDEPFNHRLYERVKALIIHEISWLVKSESDKFGIDEHTLQYAVIDVIKVDPIDKQSGFSEKKIYRSTNKLPKRIRIKGMSPLVYVGTADRSVPYFYVTNYAMALRMRNVPELARAPKYALRDGYLEVYIDDAHLKKVMVGHAFVHSYNIPNETSTNVNIELDENDELLVNEDIIQLMKERILKRDLSVVMPDDKVVNISTNEESAERK